MTDPNLVASCYIKHNQGPITVDRAQAKNLYVNMNELSRLTLPVANTYVLYDKHDASASLNLTNSLKYNQTLTKELAQEDCD